MGVSISTFYSSNFEIFDIIFDVRMGNASDFVWENHASSTQISLLASKVFSSMDVLESGEGIVSTYP